MTVVVSSCTIQQHCRNKDSYNKCNHLLNTWQRFRWCFFHKTKSTDRIVLIYIYIWFSHARLEFSRPSLFFVAVVRSSPSRANARSGNISIIFHAFLISDRVCEVLLLFSVYLLMIFCIVVCGIVAVYRWVHSYMDSFVL